MLEKLREFLKDNSEALVLIGEAETNIRTLVDSKADYQAKFEEAKTTRDATKAKYREIEQLVKDNLGVEDITKDSILEKLKSGDADIDKLKETYEAQISNLKGTITDVTAEKDNITNEFNKKLETYIADNEAQKVLNSLEGLKKSPFLQKAFKEELLANTKIEEGRIIPQVDRNGVLIPLSGKDGKELSLNEKALLMKENKDYSDFFDVSTKSGDNGAGSTESSNADLSKMSKLDKFKYYEQQIGDGNDF